MRSTTTPTVSLIATLTVGLGCTPSWTNTKTTSSEVPSTPAGTAPSTAAPELPAGTTTTTRTATLDNPESTTTTSATYVPGLSMSPASSGPTTDQRKASALTDAQVAEIADDASRALVEQGRYAALHANNPRIKAFARHMVAAHSDIRQEMTALLQREQLVRAGSVISTEMTKNAQDAFAALRSRTGAGFDTAYIEVQVKECQEELDRLDDELIPNTTDRELKSKLQTVRRLTADYLLEAKEVQRTVKVFQ
jgi:putative membrane protein